jgi:hypothetical protein
VLALNLPSSPRWDARVGLFTLPPPSSVPSRLLDVRLPGPDMMMQRESCPGIQESIVTCEA